MRSSEAPLGTRWHKIWSKRFSLRLGENWFFSVREFRTIFGISFPDQLVIIRDGFGTGYLNGLQWQTAMAQLLSIVEEKNFDDYFEQRALIVFSDFSAYCARLNERNWHNASNEELRKEYEGFVAREDRWMNFVWFIFLLDEVVSKRLEEVVLLEWPDQPAAALSTILSSSQWTAAAEFERDLLQAAISGWSAADLGALAKKYAFFPVLNLDEEPLAIEDVEKRFRELKSEERDPQASLDRLVAKRADSDHRFRVLVQPMENPVHRRIVGAAHKIAYFREFRNDVRQKNYFLIRAFFHTIANRLHLSPRQTAFLTRQELLRSLQISKPVVDERSLDSRIRRMALRSEGPFVRYVFEQGDLGVVDALLAQEEFDAQRIEFERSNVLRGVPASPGLIRGVVQCIRNLALEGAKMNSGDILVTTTTNLAFVPLMERAGAIVTDEGGLLTHAAIVARELGKPCVSGTHFATRVLHDGDYVEVDGGTGHIRRLTKR